MLSCGADKTVLSTCAYERARERIHKKTIVKKQKQS